MIKLIAMRLLNGFWLFYQKLVIPSLIVSTMLSVLVFGYTEAFKGCGISFIFLTPAFHYFTYDLKNPNEYYFYYNLGLGKLLLWSGTVLFSFLGGLILCLL
ncbi:hypothetical protein ACXZ1K_16335 [Pedobacter sp. PWIIR3]